MLGNFFNNLALTILSVALIPMVILAAFGIAANLVQHRPLLSLEPITPKLSKISPFTGAKRMFSRDALVNFAKGLFKLGVVGGVLVAVLWPERDRLETMVTLDPAALLPAFQQMGLKVFGAVLAVVTLIALVDYVYQRQRWWTRLKMTVQEVRDEFKQMEGNPEIKGRIRKIRMERSRKRMMANVPKATVVITNPTHFAVALKYDRTMKAPQCLAKGDFVQQIDQHLYRIVRQRWKLRRYQRIEHEREDQREAKPHACRDRRFADRGHQHQDTADPRENENVEVGCRWQPVERNHPPVTIMSASRVM